MDEKRENEDIFSNPVTKLNCIIDFRIILLKSYEKIIKSTRTINV